MLPIKAIEMGILTATIPKPVSPMSDGELVTVSALIQIRKVFRLTNDFFTVGITVRSHTP